MCLRCKLGLAKPGLVKGEQVESGQVKFRQINLGQEKGGLDCVCKVSEGFPEGI